MKLCTKCHYCTAIGACEKAQEHGLGVMWCSLLEDDYVVSMETITDHVKSINNPVNRYGDDRKRYLRSVADKEGLCVAMEINRRTMMEQMGT